MVLRFLLGVVLFDVWLLVVRLLFELVLFCGVCCLEVLLDELLF